MASHQLRRSLSNYIRAGVALILAVIAVPSTALADDDTLTRMAQFDFEMNVTMIGMQSIIAAWIFILGACFGSFLNVVIYRLPAGMSLGKPKSRCPRCETPLAAKDNIPVLGWIMLKGKCRYCQLPIAPRYPIVEAVCGCVFLTLLFGELLTGAANLPFRHADHFHVNPGFWLVWFAKWDLLGLYLYHCCMLVVVLAITMIGYDGHAPQRRLSIFAVTVALVPGAMWPELRPVPGWLTYPNNIESIAIGFQWTDNFLNPGGRYWTGITLVGFLDGVLGVLGGILFGWITTAPFQRRGSTSEAACSAAIRSAFVVVGAFIGWQACGSLAILALPAITCTSLALTKLELQNRLRISAPAFFVALWIFMLIWNPLNKASWMIGFEGWKFSALPWQADWSITTAGLLITSIAARKLLETMSKSPDMTYRPSEPQQATTESAAHDAPIEPATEE